MTSSAVALAALALLNLADIVTTHAVLSHVNATESNPLASFLLTSGRVGLIKAAVLVGLVYRLWRKGSTLAVNAALWFASGFYFLTVVSNLLVLRTVAG